MNLPLCPVCESHCKTSRFLSIPFLRSSLSKYYRKELPGFVVLRSYHMMTCQKCSLEFADPMVPGDPLFYGWISQQTGYYPQARWEWNAVIRELNKRKPPSITLLEVGCGSGRFLELLKLESEVQAIGLDTEPGAIDKCRRKGCEAYCQDLIAFLEERPSSRFDFVVAFHCLEHVPEPRRLLETMLSALKPGGTIFLSTPYSPMSFETGWFDPLNHPPHHMTRWNARAYEELASIFGLNILFRMPPSAGILKRAYEALILGRFGPMGAPSKQIGRLSVVKAFWKIPIEIVKQACRARLNGGYCSDVVLAEFFK